MSLSTNAFIIDTEEGYKSYLSLREVYDVRHIRKLVKELRIPTYKYKSYTHGRYRVMFLEAHYYELIEHLEKMKNKPVIKNCSVCYKKADRYYHKKYCSKCYYKVYRASTKKPKLTEEEHIMRSRKLSISDKIAYYFNKYYPKDV